MNEFFSGAETLIIRVGILIGLALFAWKHIRHEIGRDRPAHRDPEIIYVLVTYPTMTDDKAGLRAALRLAISTIRKMKANQNVNTGEVLRILLAQKSGWKKSRALAQGLKKRIARRGAGA